MAPLKRIAFAGANGSLGRAVLAELISSGTFSITLLSRTPTPTPLPSGVTEAIVDFASESSLAATLENHDAVVSTLGSQAIPAVEPTLVRAAVAAGVRRFIPSSFGSDLSLPLTRALPVFKAKVEVEDLLKQEAAKSGGKFGYTFVYNCAFLDWGLERAFLVDVKGRKATLLDGGDFPVSVTRLSTVGKAVVGVLGRPEETADKVVKVHDGRVSMREIVEAVREVTGTKESEWEVKDEGWEAVKARSDEALGKGVVDLWVWIGYLVCSSQSERFGAGFEGVENELLGLPVLGAKELKGLVKEIVGGQKQ